VPASQRSRLPKWSPATSAPLNGTAHDAAAATARGGATAAAAAQELVAPRALCLAGAVLPWLLVLARVCWVFGVGAK
jgi:hypothetical protein